MKPSFFSEYCFYAAVRGVGRLVRWLPVPWAAACGRGLGRFAYWAQPKRRAICLGNLTAAFRDERSPEALERICRGVFETIGMSFVEMLLTPSVDEPYLRRWVTVEGLPHLDQAMAQGRGVVIVTGHFGNWELINLSAGLRGYPVSVLARPQGLPRLNRLLNDYRESKGCRVISRGMAARAMVQRLRGGGLVGVLMDQDAGRRGVLAPFFGRLASTADGPITLARRLGAAIVPVFIIRGRGPHHTIHIEPPLEAPLLGDLARDVQATVAAYLEILERYVRRAPEQWLWPHRRWKSSPHQAVVALSDGKPGHRTQAAAVAELVQQAWETRVGADARLRDAAGPFMRRELVEVRYRSSWRRGVLTLAAACGATAWGSPRRWLRWALVSSSAHALESTWATHVVSCGAAAGVVNLVWSRSRNARAVHVMRPPWPLGRRFALRVIPRHDRAVEDARTVVTHGALHTVSSARMAEQAARHRPRWPLRRAVQLGLLLGGDSRGVRLPMPLVAAVVEQVLAAAEALDAELVVTTSRRTSPAVEQWLEQRLAGHPRCPVLVIARRDPADGVVPAILGMAAAVVVSGESMSMVSEAAASDKPVLVFEPQARWPRPKARRFLSALTASGRLAVVPPAQLGTQLIAAVRETHAVAPVDDRAHLLARLAKWL